MELLKTLSILAMAAVCVIGLYVAGAVVGYVMAIICIVFIVVGILSVFIYIVFDGISYLLDNRKRKKKNGGLY